MEGPVVIMLVAVLAVVSGYHHDTLFPSNDEYELFEFHPSTTVEFPPLWSSAPYGGYSRACSSRLSKLPLRLIGEGAQFEQESQVELPFFTIRDGQGRLFSCKAYTQEELHDLSIHDSVFNDALLMEPDNDQVDSTQPSTSQDANAVKDSHNQKQNAPYLPARNSFNFGGTGENIFGLVDRELQGACAQFHSGYWSYEWCYKDTFRQFHVASNKADRPGFFIYTVDTVILLGKYRSEALKSTTVRLDSHQQDTAIRTSPRTTTTPSSTKDYTILQMYKGGTLCETTGKPRKAKVILKCCSEQQTKILLEQQQQQQRPQQLFTSPSPSDKILLLKVDEDKDNVCTYEAEVCTPLLCPNVYGNNNHFYDPTNWNNELFQQRTPWLRSQQQQQSSTTSTSIRGSIRLILQNALEGLCLQRQDGWWRYEICHMKHTRQFHIGTAVDSTTGVAIAKVETDHLLGLYLDEAITKGYSYKKGGNNNNNNNNNNDDDDKEEELEVHHMEHRETTEAAYVIEYANGDLCDNSPEDVRDQALTQVARSTTVKYSCGKNYDLARIEEDRTCHYVFYVTIPDLCRHPWFHIPVRKEQVIKCLPVPSDFS